MFKRQLHSHPLFRIQNTLKAWVFVFLLGCFPNWNGSDHLLAQDVASFIQQTERLPRVQRIRAYENALSSRRLNPAGRIALAKAFSKHTVKLSPLYSTSARWNTRPWINVLGDAWKSDPADLTLSLAYCQLLINAGDQRNALQATQRFKQQHPGNHEANAWHALASGSIETKIRKFPVHFCVLTKNPAAHRVATKEQCVREVQILNQTFRSMDGKPLVEFVFKSFTPYQIASNSRSEMVRYGDSTATYNSDAIAKAFNQCDDPRIRDRGAINVYIFDAHSKSGGFKDVTSHGKRNSNRPYVLLDYARLNNAIQNAEAHEMGHAFGLGHVGVPNAKIGTPTNIMTSAGESFGSGGKRDVGFTPAQVALIRYHAVRTHGRLGLK